MRFDLDAIGLNPRAQRLHQQAVSAPDVEPCSVVTERVRDHAPLALPTNKSAAGTRTSGSIAAATSGPVNYLKNRISMPTGILVPFCPQESPQLRDAAHQLWTPLLEVGQRLFFYLLRPAHAFRFDRVLAPVQCWRYKSSLIRSATLYAGQEVMNSLSNDPSPNRGDRGGCVQRPLQTGPVGRTDSGC